MEKKLVDLTAGIDELIEVHLFPVVQPEIIAGVRVFAAKCEIGIAHSSQKHLSYRSTIVGMQHFDSRIDGRLVT